MRPRLNLMECVVCPCDVCGVHDAAWIASQPQRFPVRIPGMTVVVLHSTPVLGVLPYFSRIFGPYILVPPTKKSCGFNFSSYGSHRRKRYGIQILVLRRFQPRMTYVKNDTNAEAQFVFRCIFREGEDMSRDSTPVLYSEWYLYDSTHLSPVWHMTNCTRYV